MSGPFKTKLGVVERFNRTIKLFLNILMAGYNTCDWAATRNPGNWMKLCKVFGVIVRLSFNGLFRFL